MKKVFVDTNIIVDLLADRRPHSKFAIELFKKAERNEVELFTSSHSIATSHYLLKKYINDIDTTQPSAATNKYLQKYSGHTTATNVESKAVNYTPSA